MWVIEEGARPLPSGIIAATSGVRRAAPVFALAASSCIFKPGDFGRVVETFANTSLYRMLGKQAPE